MSETRMVTQNERTRNENAMSAMPKTGTMNVFADAAAFDSAMKMASCLAKSTVVPKEYQGNEGNCMIAIEMAARINTSPMMVMQNLYIVNGRPAWSSQWIIAMINSSHRYKTEIQFEYGDAKEDGGLSCQAWVEDWNGHIVRGPKITMTMAQNEGWVGKNGSKWKTMPEVMMQYRAASFFGRMNCPDMIMGIYSQEEVIDGGFDDDYRITVDGETGEIIEQAPVDNTPVTQEQRQELFKIAKEIFGDECNAIVKELLNKKGYDSTNGMPASVCNELIEAVKKMGAERKAQSEKKAPKTSEPKENAPSSAE